MTVLSFWIISMNKTSTLIPISLAVTLTSYRLKNYLHLL